MDSDYYSIETAHFLTEDEKKAIQKRKDELKRLSNNRAQQKIVMELDFETGTVRETKSNEIQEKYEDEVIQSILSKAEQRQAKQETYKLRDPNLPSAKKFVPSYNAELSTSTIPAASQFEFSDAYVDKDQRYTEVERKSYFIAFPQPLASSIASGNKRYRHFF